MVHVVVTGQQFWIISTDAAKSQTDDRLELKSNLNQHFPRKVEILFLPQIK